MSEWLSNLKVGDKVIVSSFRGCDVTATISRLTKTKIILNGSLTKYRKADGHCAGDYHYYRTYLKKWSQEEQEKQDIILMKASVSDLSQRKMTLDQLKQAYSLIKFFSENANAS